LGLERADTPAQGYLVRSFVVDGVPGHEEWCGFEVCGGGGC
jgi:hypothetical protein